MRGLGARAAPEAAAREALGSRLRRDGGRPLAVALSGGGDSLALTLIADAWAREAGRDLLVLTVDHRLRPESRDWTEACAALAARLGRPFRALAWEGEKPTTGLPAAAREARHRLLADAAREARARVLLMGHTADDVLEAKAMREAGSTTPAPQAWAPSPAWPEGRGLFILRPLLGVRRAALRGWLAARGETWIEDPANADPRFARSRARAQAIEAELPAAAGASTALALADHVTEARGVLTFDRGPLRAAAPADVRRLLALACVCAGGGSRRPATARLARAAAALAGPDRFVATLAGARVEAEARVRIFREAGEAARGGLAAMALPEGREIVWDGRFAVIARRAGQSLRPLAGLAARLAADQQARLRELPPAARRGLPALVDADGRVTCPTLAPSPDAEVASLVGERFAAAAGRIQREPA